LFDVAHRNTRIQERILEREGATKQKTHQILAPPVEEPGIVVQPAAASQLVLGEPSSVRHGTTFSLTLTVEDAYGNVVTDYLCTIHFSSSDWTATLPANYTFTTADAGVHTFANVFILRTRGKPTLTATDTQNSSLTATDSINVT
jgi:hypothetical protein